LTGIKLIGAGWENPFSGVGVQTELSSYSAADAQRGSILGRFPQAGKVEAFMCNDCRRIFLYGAAGEK
jgi:hypothetical protein